MQPQIVVIDDDDDVRSALENLLASAGFACVSYPSAEAFIDDDRWARALCILMDVTMSGMSGLELQDHLRSVGVRKPVIVMTARIDEETRIRAIGNGAVAVVPKPFDEDALIETIERLKGSGSNATPLPAA